ncbi:MAG: HAMP domain-containing sensor histidine kinase [Salinivirgaceae bacterium]|nr:HAMP domain-containing sensor histidine kinase [Salinivirgaceae bacterium]
MEACVAKKDRQSLINTLIKKNEELEQAIERERQTNALRDSFLKNLSHEIRTPLNSLLGFNQLISMNSDDPKMEQYSRYALNSGNELMTTIENMLEASKIANNQVVYRNAPCNAENFMLQCINQWKALSRQDQAIRTHISSDAPIFIDKQKTERAIFAILTNAHQIAPEMPIDIYLKEVDNNVLIEIADHGPGIPDSQLKSIFEPFGKSKTDGSVNKSGIGISLYIAKSHINNMNGHIDVLSEPSRGARFFITFPVFCH